MKSLIYLLIAMTIGALVTLLQTYIVKDIVHLFDIPFLISLTFIQFYGLIVIKNIILYKHKSSKKIKTADEALLNFFEVVTSVCVAVLFAWGFAYIMHYFIS